MVKQTKQNKMLRSTIKKTKSRTRKHVNRRVSRSNKMRGGAAPHLIPNTSFNKGTKPLLPDISVDFPVYVLLPDLADMPNIEVYYSDSLPESDTILWTPQNKVYPATNANNKYYQTHAYENYISIIKEYKNLPVPNKQFVYNGTLYYVSGNIKFTLSFYGIHKQTNLPILLMTKDDNKRKGYLFAKQSLPPSEPY